MRLPRLAVPARPTLPGLGGLRRAAALSPPVEIEGPRVRLGLVWAAVTLVAVVIGPFPTALVFAVTALAAAGQTARSWRGTARRPHRPVAVAGAVACALAGSAGPEAVVGAALITSFAGVAIAGLRIGGRDWDARVTIAIALLVGVGAATPALLREVGLVPALVFVFSVHAIDAATFIVGSGAASRWEGPVAGFAAAAAIGLAAAAVLVPPFRGASPWVLAALVGLLAPVGTYVATALLGRDEAPVPALRRLDAYLVAGPVWAVAARLLLDL